MAYARNLSAWAGAGWITDLEALAQLSDAAASLIPTDMEGRTTAYINDMSYVLIGAEGAGVLLGSFFPDHEEMEFGDTGFHQDYQDQQNQLYHFWAYVATIGNANNFGGWFLSSSGNVFHEFLDPSEAFRTLARGGITGATWEDYHLAYTGMVTGMFLENGTIPIEDADDFMRLALSTEFPGTKDDWQRSLGATWWPSRVWESAVTTVYQGAFIINYYCSD
jgi:hypothetical protein